MRLKRFQISRRGRSHVDDVVQYVDIRAGCQYLRLFGVLEQGPIFFLISSAGFQFSGLPHAHEKVDVGKAVGHTDGVQNAIVSKWLWISGFHVQQIRTVRSGTEIDVGPFKQQSGFLIAVIDGNFRRRFLQSLFHHGFGNVGPIVGTDGGPPFF